MCSSHASSHSLPRPPRRPPAATALEEAVTGILERSRRRCNASRLRRRRHAFPPSASLFPPQPSQDGSRILEMLPRQSRRLTISSLDSRQSRTILILNALNSSRSSLLSLSLSLCFLAAMWLAAAAASVSRVPIAVRDRPPFRGRRRSVAVVFCRPLPRQGASAKEW